MTTLITLGKAMFILFRFFERLGDFVNIIILTPNSYAVGNAAEEVYFGLLKARRLKRKLVILFPYELPWKFKFRLIDINLFEIESRYLLTLPIPLNIICRLLISIIYLVNKAVGMTLRKLLSNRYLISDLYNLPMLGFMTLWQPKSRMDNFTWNIVDAYHWRDQLASPLKVRASKKVRETCSVLREQLGVPKNAWYVCLHVRESGFHGDNAGERNASIANYIPAIKEITSRGGWVIRMGDATMTRLPKLNQVIDYPFTDFKSPRMDMFLISECSLYVGMTSGIYDLAVLFERPIILTNMSSWLFGLPPKITDVCLLKHNYSRKKGRFLSVREWLEEPWESMSYRTISSDYVLYENSEQEIQSAVKNYFERDQNWAPTILQEEFLKCRLENGKKILNHQIFSGDLAQQKFSDIVDNPFDEDFHLYDMLERYRLASRLDSVQGLIDSSFILKNWEKTPMAVH